MKSPTQCNECLIIFERELASVSKVNGKLICTDCGQRESGVKPQFTEKERELNALLRLANHSRKRL